MKYIFWYKKEVIADDLQSAILTAKEEDYTLSNVIQEEEQQIKTIVVKGFEG